MMTLYKVLTYLLLPFAAIFSLMAVFAFFLALANPALFLGVFMLAAVGIYSFCCVRFLRQGLDMHRPLKSKLKDWIKVNAYVALPFAILNFMQSFTIIGKPSLLQEVVRQMVEMQQNAGLPAQPADMYSSFLMALLYIMLVVSIALLVHILLSFSLLKKYSSLFDGPGPSSNA